MLVSTEVMSFHEYGTNKEIIKLLKDAGFDAYDFSMYGLKEMDTFIDKEDYLERAKDLRAYADSIGIVCNQTHAFFPTIRYQNEEWNKMGIELTKKSIEVSGILGAKACVVHPCHEYTPKENADMYHIFLDVAKQYNVKVASENMWSWDESVDHAIPAACSSPKSFCDHMALLEDKYYVACLDLGHAEMRGVDTSAVEMIKALSSNGYLKCLHIHDNDKHHDCHRLPYTFDIDFEPIIDALAEGGYDGDVTFEADQFVSRFPKALYPAAARLMCAVGKYIREEIIARRNK